MTPCLDDLANLTFSLILEAIAAGPDADEFVHLLCVPDAGAEKETPREAGRWMEG